MQMEDRDEDGRHRGAERRWQATLGGRISANGGKKWGKEERPTEARRETKVNIGKFVALVVCLIKENI